MRAALKISIVFGFIFCSIYVKTYTMEIYKITNTITNDFYIGSAVNFSNRKIGHRNSFKYNKHKNQFMQNSWNKYGEEAFVFEVIEIVDKKENLIVREQYWIDTLSPTFNLCKIAGSPLGVKHTDEARMNMSLAHLGKPLSEMGHTPNCICPICSPKTGENSPRYIQREERKCACGCGTEFTCRINEKKRFVSGHNKSNLGKKPSKETIDKQKASIKKYYENGGKSPRLGTKSSVDAIDKMRKKKLVPILQYDLNGNFIREWDGIITASRELGIDDGTLCNYLRNRRKKTGDFIWKYKLKIC